MLPSLFLVNLQTPTTRIGQIREKKSIKGITNDSVERALSELRGTILQKPPMFSAKKIKGGGSTSLLDRERK